MRIRIKNLSWGGSGCIGILVAIWALAGVNFLRAGERSSAAFRDTRNSLNSGGSNKTSTSFILNSSISEISKTTATSTSFHHRAGVMTTIFYPSTVIGVTATTGPYAGSVRLNWTAPSAEGGNSNANAYVIKWDSNPISDQTMFYAATTYAQTWIPAALGTSEARILSNLRRDSTIYVQIEARDIDKNQSYLSNTCSTSAPAALVAIDIAPVSYNFGSQALGNNLVAATSFTVTNSGNVNETYSLTGTTATAQTLWFLGTNNANVDEIVLRAVFHATEPMTSSFQADDNLTYASQKSNSTRFSADGSTTAVNVNVFEIRNLWANLRMPSVSRTTDTQAMTISVTAEEEP